MTESEASGCGPGATSPDCRALTGRSLCCEVPLDASFCSRTTLRAWARLPDEVRLADIRSSVTDIGC